MRNGQKTYKTRIQGAEDFGLLFNCLTRRYLWNYEEELLELMLRIVDRYLAYFSQRTLVTSIRDLAREKDGVFCECHEGKPKEQEERYDRLLMRLIKRYLTITLDDTDEERWRSMKIREFASVGEFVREYGSEEDWMFSTKEAFEQWVRDNRLDENDGMAREPWKIDLLPISKGFLDDFCRLCLAAVQYSFGRLSYMPSACREFIWDNRALLSDEGLNRIAGEIESLLERYPVNIDRADVGESNTWRAFSKKMRGELCAGKSLE